MQYSVPQGYTLEPFRKLTALNDFQVPVTVPDDFTGTITGIPRRLEIVKVPRTTVELTLSPMGDAYDVSIMNGFNIKAKVSNSQYTLKIT